MIVDIDNMHINIHEKLKVAVVQQNLDKVQKYLAQGADVNYINKVFPDDDDPALIKAMQYNYEDGVKYEPNIEIIKLLIENGADVNGKDFFDSSPLHYAVELKNTEISKLLIDKGADVNAKNSYGHTPLHHAAINSLENAKILIENGANINAISNDDKTPLDIAKEYSESKYTCSATTILVSKKVVSLLKTIQKPKVKTKAKTKTKQKSNDFSMGM